MVGFIQHIPQQSLSEDTSLPLSSFVAEALKIRGGISPSRYQLMDIEFGSEFRRHTLGVSAIRLTWTLERLSVTLRTRHLQLFP
jgi:hypothetical protein